MEDLIKKYKKEATLAKSRNDSHVENAYNEIVADLTSLIDNGFLLYQIIPMQVKLPVEDQEVIFANKSRVMLGIFQMEQFEDKINTDFDGMGNLYDPKEIVWWMPKPKLPTNHS